MLITLLASFGFAEPPPPCKAPGQTHYAVHAKVDVKRQRVTVQQRVEVTNGTDTDWPWITLRVPDPPAQLRGIQATLDDQPVTFFQRGRALAVDIIVPAGASQAFELTFELALPIHDFPAKRPTEFGIVKPWVLLGDWLPLVAPIEDGVAAIRPQAPRGDHAFFEPADFRLSLTAPAGQVVSASGISHQSPDTKRGWTTHHFEANGVRQLAVAVCNDCSVQAIPAGPVNLRVVSKGAANPNVISQALASTLWMTERFGPLSSPELDLLVIRSGAGWGVEYPGLLLLSEADPDNPEQHDFMVAHEVAHQWWYSEVGNDQWLNPWIDEALATWSSFAWLETRDQPLLRPSYHTWAEWQEYGVEGSVLSSVLDLQDAPYTSLVYQRGSDFWEAVRLEDPEGFDRSIRRYYLENRCLFAGDTTLLDIVRQEQTAPTADAGALYKLWIDPTWPNGVTQLP